MYVVTVSFSVLSFWFFSVDFQTSNVFSEHFIYSDTKVTWDEATEYCVYGGMTLAHSLNPRENVAIVKLAREKSPLDDLGLSHPYLNRNWVNGIVF